MKTIVHLNTVMFAAILACACWLLLPAYAYASAAGCQMGFLNGTSIANGQIDGNVGNEWNDASLIQSGVQCLDFLRDWDSTTTPAFAPTLYKQVMVYSKRDGSNLYMAFDVPDQTEGTGSLSGEQIIIQIDPDLGNGTVLSNDIRIEVSHQWNVTNVRMLVAQSDTGGCAGKGHWVPKSAPSLAAALGVFTAPKHYAVEIKVALSDIGNPTGDIGIAFALVNDLHHDSGIAGSPVWDATGVAFPNSLPMNNTSNVLDDPTTPVPCAWHEPRLWGVGYWDAAAGDVTISNLPVSWNSQDIEAFACHPGPGVLPTYEYYPANPCRLVLKATLHSTAEGQRRNILFLWAEHGNNPTTWRFMDLVEDVVMPMGDITIMTNEWAGMPPNLDGHPCVRVYILPETYDPAFDRNRISAIASDTDVQTLETTYYPNGIGDHRTQKNISARTATEVCPNAQCRITSGFQFASFTFEQPLQLTENKSLRMLQTKLQGGNTLLMAEAEANVLSTENAIMQFRAFGSSPTPPNVQYNFIEDLGGAIQLVPLDLLQEPQKLSFDIEVTNPRLGKEKVDRTIFLLEDTFTPPEFELQIQPQFELKGELFTAGEIRPIEGVTLLTEKEQPFLDPWIQPDLQRLALCDPALPWLTYNTCLVATGQWPPPVELPETGCTPEAGVVYGACLIYKGDWEGLKLPPIEERERYGIER